MRPFDRMTEIEPNKTNLRGIASRIMWLSRVFHNTILGRCSQLFSDFSVPHIRFWMIMLPNGLISETHTVRVLELLEILRLATIYDRPRYRFDAASSSSVSLTSSWKSGTYDPSPIYEIATTRLANVCIEFLYAIALSTPAKEYTEWWLRLCVHEMLLFYQSCYYRSNCAKIFCSSSKCIGIE